MASARCCALACASAPIPSQITGESLELGIGSTPFGTPMPLRSKRSRPSFRFDGPNRSCSPARTESFKSRNLHSRWVKNFVRIFSGSLWSKNEFATYTLLALQKLYPNTIRSAPEFHQNFLGRLPYILRSPKNFSGEVQFNGFAGEFLWRLSILTRIPGTGRHPVGDGCGKIGTNFT